MLIQTVKPAVEPVTPDDLYTRSRIEQSDEDLLLISLISAARRYAEHYTGRSFITQSWKLVMDGFPNSDGSYGGGFGINGTIELDMGQVQSIDSIGYVAMDGTTQVMSPQSYVADLSGCPARITPVFGEIWPINKPQIASAWVNYTAGYGPTPEDVPEGIRDWILMRAGTIYDNREAVSILERGVRVGDLPYVDSLLDPYRVVLA